MKTKMLVAGIFFGLMTVAPQQSFADDLDDALAQAKELEATTSEVDNSLLDLSLSMIQISHPAPLMAEICNISNDQVIDAVLKQRASNEKVVQSLSETDKPKYVLEVERLKGKLETEFASLDASGKERECSQLRKN